MIPGPGELAPKFRAATDLNPQFDFGTMGGQWLLLAFLGSLGEEASKDALETVVRRRSVFDDVDALYFGVSMDPADRAVRGLANSMPGLRYFWDFDGKVGRLYGLIQKETLQPTAFLLDRALRVVAVAPIGDIAALIDRLAVEMLAERPLLKDQFAPVLTVPRIFEPEFCAELIAYYDRQGGRESGFMREVGGLTVPVKDPGYKRRKDAKIEDEDLRRRALARINGRLLPMIEHALGWRATRIERHIVACYTAEDTGFFAPHRDNTTSGTAHRKFAVSLNLNSEFKGGELRFPEFGRRTYKPPPGGATVFGCGLLHEATPVTEGIRYAYLPFLYDEHGKGVREANKSKLVLDPERSSSPEPSSVDGG